MINIRCSQHPAHSQALHSKRPTLIISLAATEARIQGQNECPSVGHSWLSRVSASSLFVIFSKICSPSAMICSLELCVCVCLCFLPTSIPSPLLGWSSSQLLFILALSSIRHHGCWETGLICFPSGSYRTAEDGEGAHFCRLLMALPSNVSQWDWPCRSPQLSGVPGMRLLDAGSLPFRGLFCLNTTISISLYPVDAAFFAQDGTERGEVILLSLGIAIIIQRML